MEESRRGLTWMMASGQKKRKGKIKAVVSQKVNNTNGIPTMLSAKSLARGWINGRNSNLPGDAVGTNAETNHRWCMEVIEVSGCKWVNVKSKALRLGFSVPSPAKKLTPQIWRLPVRVQGDPWLKMIIQVPASTNISSPFRKVSQKLRTEAMQKCVNHMNQYKQKEKEQEVTTLVYKHATWNPCVFDQSLKGCRIGKNYVFLN